MAVARTYTVPPSIDLSQVLNLTPEHTHRAALSPTSLVVCRNRGPHHISDMFDAHPYELPPFALFQVTYAAACHLQRRAIVAGTRNPDPNDPTMPQYVSWIGILGVDPEDACEPFSDDELKRFKEFKEGLNRQAMDPRDRDVTVVPTNDLRRALPGMGAAPSAQALAAAAGDVGRGVNQQVVGGSDELRAAALEPVVGSDAATATAEALAKGWTPGEESDLTGERSAPKPGAKKGSGRR